MLLSEKIAGCIFNNKNVRLVKIAPWESCYMWYCDGDGRVRLCVVSSSGGGGGGSDGAQFKCC